MAKGDCFEAAYRYLSELHEEGEADISLCHGIITTLNGTFCHAWVEKKSGNDYYVFEVTNGQYVPLGRPDYYRTLSIKGVVRYDVKQATIESLRHEHFGPWHPSFARMR